MVWRRENAFARSYPGGAHGYRRRKVVHSQISFGFIQSDDSGKDAFIHLSVGMSDLREGQRISFELIGARSGNRSADKLQAV
jgi:cold shock CspA family protein